MKSQYALTKKVGLILLLISLFAFHKTSFANSPQYASGDTLTHVQFTAAEQHSSHEENNTSPLLFIALAIIVGAATRHFLKKNPLPYTVLLLIFGILFGIIARAWSFSGIGGEFAAAVKWAGNIDPHVILFVFLPTLIFEAAFNIDIHTFKKTSVNATLLAVPGIVIAMIITAAFLILFKTTGIGLLEWDWKLALLFGALISASDPVAVVAILKELGVSKKLSTLIDGEAILNDGTAIVLFLVFFTMITGGADSSPFIDFLRVSFGGILVGLIIAWLLTWWLKYIHNDALIEIGLIVAAAYFTFIVAETLFHVSGVLGLFSLGLYMAAKGKTRISPVVEHFMKEFWEFAAFIANTLIFIIVGIIIAQRTVFNASDFMLLGLIYIVIHIARGAMIALLFPLMRNIGYGLSFKDSIILGYGALRGAVGLALSLVVLGVDDKYISPEIKNQFVFFTAGIVTLTLLINATTTKIILQKLGLAKILPAQALALYSNKKYLSQSTENMKEQLKNDKTLKNADWKKIDPFLPEEPMPITDFQSVNRIAETRRILLEKEKSSYWDQFKEGFLDANSVQKLISGIDEILDNEGKSPLSKRNDLENLLKTSHFLVKFSNTPIIGSIIKRNFFEKLLVGFDAANGLITAHGEMIQLIESIQRNSSKEDNSDDSIIFQLLDEINENKLQANTFLRNLRKNHPDIYKTILTRKATRTLLNYELHSIERLLKKGRINESEAEKLREDNTERTKRYSRKIIIQHKSQYTEEKV